MLQGIPLGDGPVSLFDLTLREGLPEALATGLQAYGIQICTVPSLIGGHSLDKLRMRWHGSTGSTVMAHEQVGILTRGTGARSKRGRGPAIH